MRRHCFVLILLLIVSFIVAETNLTINHDKSDFIIEQYGEFTKIYYRDGEISGEPGTPQLPSRVVSVLVPPQSEASDILITNEIWEPLAKDIVLFPAQKPYPFSKSNIELTQPDLQSYAQNNWLPSNAVELTRTGNMSGYKIAGVIIYPIRYNPVTQEAEYLQSADISIMSESSTRELIQPLRRTEMSQERFETLLREIVVNPSDIGNYNSILEIDPDAYDYILVCQSERSSWWDEYRRLIRIKGLRDTTIFVDDITGFYGGADDAEDLRNAVIETYTETGASYLVLLGDVEIVPARWLYAMDSEAGIRDNENQLWSDFYYSDLDGDFNADGDTIYGEVDDEVDMYPDIFVGRIPVYEYSEYGYVEKLTTYELNPPSGYLDNILFAGEILWDEPFTDAGEAKNYIHENYLPESYDPIKLYETRGNENLETVTDAIEAGVSIFNHNGHGFYSIMGTGDGSPMSDWNVYELNHVGLYGIVYSIGCWCGAFDYDDCIAEAFIKNTSGGAIAYFGNSRYGWGSPGNPYFGYSNILDSRFYDYLFNNEISKSAELLAAIKIRYAPYSHWENTWRWHQYELNLFGDPSFNIRTKEASSLEFVEIPEIVSGDNRFTLCIESSDMPVEGVISVLANGELIEAKSADYSGCAELTFYTDGTEMVELFASAHEYIPAIETLSVSGSDVSFNMSYETYADSLDFADGELNPGDSGVLLFKIKNTGTESSMPGITFYSELVRFGDIEITSEISPDEEIVVPVNVEIDEEITFGDILQISAVIDDGVMSHSRLMTIEPNVASLYLERADIYAGDDFRVSIDEEILGTFVVKNIGNGTSRDYFIDIIPAASNLDILDISPDETVIPPGDSAYVFVEMQVVTSCSILPIVPMIVDIEDFDETIWLLVNEKPFFDGAELGMEYMTHGGINDYWHATDARSANGENSFWCGSDGLGIYVNNTDAWMRTPIAYIGELPKLEFDLYYDVTIYGNDGLYVSYIHSDDTTTIDYIGSGGALGTLPLTTGWCHYSYNLDVTEGDAIQLLFRMKTDEIDAFEGVYIDNIEITQGIVRFVESPTSITETTSKPEQMDIDIYPNPVNGTMKIRFENTFSNGKLEIVDILGNIIDTRSLDSGNSVFISTDNVKSGVYLVKLSSGNNIAQKKVVIIK